MSAVEAEGFERRYRVDPDPWSYETSPYERRKYERTLAALPPGPIDDALELGCSTGAFTELLAERCARTVAVDFSFEAVRLARRRLAESRGVTIEQRDLRAGLPAGTFDLVVCSELLYYWEEADVIAFCERTVTALAPEGSLVAVHWRGDDPDAPLDGDAVHGLLHGGLADRLAHTLEKGTPAYRLDRWTRAAKA